ncbi:MAG TPA: ribosome small subunit-dependent GTPase A [Candidatus Saccharimonadales bacterium]|nr:ribosome small subunit-dependent GTPase A [Candidatus Saccharimonadales bacterium]
MILAQMFGPSALVWDGTSLLPATLDPKLKKSAGRGHSLLAVGDEVETARAADGVLSIVAIAPRRTQLARAGGDGRDAQVVAANAERAVIISSADEPPFRPGLVDRWALLAYRGGLEPFLVLNKVDLVTVEQAERMIEEAAVPLSHTVSSAKTGAGIEELHASLRGKTSVFVGHSGVGKSSILRRLFPDLVIETATVSEKSGKGKHTTTSARLYPLPEGGHVIDTPGVRSVALGTTTVAETGAVFPEIREAGPCRFGNCTHRMEPGCSVLEGVRQGSIPENVYARYRKLLEEVEVEVE